MRKNIKVIIICMLFAFVLYGCTPSAPENSADELVCHSWVLYDGSNNESGNLSFSDGHMIFSAKTDESTVFEFDEECIINESKITIVSENYGVLNIEYTISGNKLTLSYSNKEIVLEKQNTPAVNSQ